LADEVKDQNVAVNIILPGHTRTTGSDEQTRVRAAMGVTNAPKMLVPEHVVPLVLSLASQDASQVTGKLFDVVQWNLEHGLGGRARWEDPE
jgi:NAD(P)-dependent dehydrogenase (short-subunit alcohol dehydrogenase family)